MKKPDGSIDLVGIGFQTFFTVTDLVKEFAPTPEQRSQNKRQRRIRVAIRQLKRRFKTASVANYVKVNFSDFNEDDLANTIAHIREVVGRE